VYQRGRLEAAALARANSDAKLMTQNQQIFSMFLTAIDASLSTTLAVSCDAVRVGPLTWLVPGDGEHQLLTLRAQVTSQGTLALLPHVANTCLTSSFDRESGNALSAPSAFADSSGALSVLTSSDTPSIPALPGTPVILAPSGTLATIAPLQSAVGHQDSAASHQARREARLRLSRRARDESWQASASRRLHVPHDAAWLRVSLASSSQVDCLWPEPLCMAVPIRTPPSSIYHSDSLHWFDSKHAYQNPLHPAESWFSGREKRAEQEQAIRQVDTADGHNVPDEVMSDQPSVVSPVYSRSVVDQPSVNGIYPTPPDALPPNSCADPMTMENPIEALPGISDHDPDIEARRDSNVTDIDLGPDHFRRASPDDLFGDVDEEMFGNPHVTDADFTFFDHPGGQEVVRNMSAPTDEMGQHLPDPTTASIKSQETSLVDDGEHQTSRDDIEALVKDSQTVQVDQAPENDVSTPPLSPLKIKETFLPSHLATDSTDRPRRDSSFFPVVFRSAIDNFDAKYRKLGKFDGGNKQKLDTTTRSNSIALPEKPPKTRLSKPLLQRRTTSTQLMSLTPLDHVSLRESDPEISQDSDSDSISSVDTSFRSFNIRKRKRTPAEEEPSPRSMTESTVESDAESTVSDSATTADPGVILDQLAVARENQSRIIEQQHRFVDNSSIWRNPSKMLSQTQYLHLWPVLALTDDDLINVAQLVAEQSRFPGFCANAKENPVIAAPIFCTAQDALQQIFDKAQDCDFARVGAMAAQHAEQAIAAAAKSQQRPIPRRPGTVNSVITIPVPAVRVRRGGAGWELQPTAIGFWDTLGLEPAHGSKNLVAFALFPDCGDLSESVAEFLQDVRLVYEARKLGKHQLGSERLEKPDGLVPYRSHGEASAVNVIQSLQAACTALGDSLHDAELDDTVVIYMVNPFHEEAMTKYLCGCFHSMYAGWIVGRADPPPLILQIIPINRIAHPTSLVVPDQDWSNALVSSIYDRIPLIDQQTPATAWQLGSSPWVFLASPPSRKINFALAEKAPRNLLEEAQILHVAYAINTDNSWLSAAWTDGHGKNQHIASYCLSNVDGKSVLDEVRNTTLILARDSTWRIFVARAGVMRDWEKRTWREQPAENRSIVLLDIDTCPALQVGTNNLDNTGQSAFLTPAVTPQASTFASPDTAGQPGTPSGETSQQEAQQQPIDPDAFLIDNTDETWGVLMPFSCTRSSTLSRPLASGLLLKRGDETRTAKLPSLGVDIMDIMAPRPQGGAAGGSTWLQQRAPETMLKECLMWYRGLGLLAKIRGVPGAEAGHVPWHLAVAMCSADALQGFLE
jgi:mediator of RNA polymerase II transcription subunit 13